MLGEVGAQAISADQLRGFSSGVTSVPKDDVVILGYDGSDTVSVKTETKVESKDEAPSSHLYCLKDPCRFYDKEKDRCNFDKMLSELEKVPKGGAKSGKDQASARILKELDKVWKFQTKSVSELVSTISDSEKKNAGEIAKLKKDFDKWFTDLRKRLEKGQEKGWKKEIDELRKSIESLESRLSDREESIENFSTTLSELVLGLEDSLKAVNTRTEELGRKIEEMESAVPKEKDLRLVFEELLEKTSSKRMDREWEKMMGSLEAKLAEVSQSGRDAEEKLSARLEELSSRIEGLGRRREEWEERWERWEKTQREIREMFRSEKKEREEHWSHSKKKEARKLNNLGVSTFYNGAMEEAKKHFLKAVELDPNFAEAYNNLGLVYTEMGDEEKATEAFTKAVQLDPSLPAAYNNLGYIFYKQGSYEQAIEMYHQALGKSPNSSSAYTNLGNAYFKLGKKKEAVEAWQKAVEIDPQNERARAFLNRLGGDY